MHETKCSGTPKAPENNKLSRQKEGFILAKTSINTKKLYLVSSILGNRCRDGVLFTFSSTSFRGLQRICPPKAGVESETARFRIQIGLAISQLKPRTLMSLVLLVFHQAISAVLWRAIHTEEQVREKKKGGNPLHTNIHTLGETGLALPTSFMICSKAAVSSACF